MCKIILNMNDMKAVQNYQIMHTLVNLRGSSLYVVQHLYVRVTHSCSLLCSFIQYPNIVRADILMLLLVA